MLELIGLVVVALALIFAWNYWVIMGPEERSQFRGEIPRSVVGTRVRWGDRQGTIIGLGRIKGRVRVMWDSRQVEEIDFQKLDLLGTGDGTLPT